MLFWAVGLVVVYLSWQSLSYTISIQGATPFIMTNNQHLSPQSHTYCRQRLCYSFSLGFGHPRLTTSNSKATTESIPSATVNQQLPCIPPQMTPFPSANDSWSWNLRTPDSKGRQRYITLCGPNCPLKRGDGADRRNGKMYVALIECVEACWGSQMDMLISDRAATFFPERRVNTDCICTNIADQPEFYSSESVIGARPVF